MHATFSSCRPKKLQLKQKHHSRTSHTSAMEAFNRQAQHTKAMMQEDNSGGGGGNESDDLGVGSGATTADNPIAAQIMGVGTGAGAGAGAGSSAASTTAAAAMPNSSSHHHHHSHHSHHHHHSHHNNNDDHQSHRALHSPAGSESGIVPVDEMLRRRVHLKRRGRDAATSSDSDSSEEDAALSHLNLEARLKQLDTQCK